MRGLKMKRLIKRLPIQDLLTSMLKNSIKTTFIAGVFYKYISERIRNGSVRCKFKNFSEEEFEKHKDILNNRLKCIEGKTQIVDSCKPGTYNDASSYSLIGALHIAKESIRETIKMCKIAKKQDAGHNEIYDAIIKDEKKCYKFVNKEENFPHPESQDDSLNVTRDSD